MSLTPLQIADRIEEAFRTLHNLPDNNRHRILKTVWPESMPNKQDNWFNYGRHEVSMPRIAPSPRQISEMEEVFYVWWKWIMVSDTRMTKKYNRIMVMRAFNIPWKAIGTEIGKSPKTCWRYHVSCLQSIKMKLR